MIYLIGEDPGFMTPILIRSCRDSTGKCDEFLMERSRWDVGLKSGCGWGGVGCSGWDPYPTFDPRDDIIWNFASRMKDLDETKITHGSEAELMELVSYTSGANVSNESIC